MVRSFLFFAALIFGINCVTVHVDYFLRCKQHRYFNATISLVEKDWLFDDTIKREVVHSENGIVEGRITGKVTDDGLFKDIVEMAIKVDHNCTSVKNRMVFKEFPSYDCIDNARMCIFSHKYVLDGNGYERFESSEEKRSSEEDDD